MSRCRLLECFLGQSGVAAIITLALAAWCGGCGTSASVDPAPVTASVPGPTPATVPPGPASSAPMPTVVAPQRTFGETPTTAGVPAIPTSAPAAAPAEPPAPASVRLVDPQQREAIDRFAYQAQLEPPDVRAVELAGSFTAWVLSSAAIAPAEEVTLALKRHEELLAGRQAYQSPRDVEMLLRDLAAYLPPRMRPPEFRFTVTVLEDAEPRAFSVGGGLVYLTRPLLELILQDTSAARNLLAFVLARELGHTALGHNRRGYQLQKVGQTLERGLDRSLDRAALQRALKTSLAPAGQLVQFLYSRDQEYEADLFALHLCRNAGADLPGVLDWLRWETVQEANRPAARSVAAAVEAGVPPEARLRLKRLLMELQGNVDQPAKYGLFEFDRTANAFSARAERQPAATRGVVFLHGMEGDATRYQELAARLAATPEGANLRLLALRFPNDASLACSGTFLENELKRIAIDPSRLDFVCHSAGGLVFRYYAEVLGGGYRQAVFHGTPHHGSSLASLRNWLEVKQFLGNISTGISRAVEQSVSDGRGQITHDLEPGSLFLAYLDSAPQGDRSRYTIFRGQVLGPLQQSALQLSVNAGKQLLVALGERQLPAEWRPQAQQLLDGLVVPDEVVRGDGAVTMTSAALPQVQAYDTRFDHVTLTTAPECANATIALVLRE